MQDLALLHGSTRFIAGSASEYSSPCMTMVITRNLYSSVGLQTFLPHRLLTGLMPSAILEAYDFWQNEDDSLIGYPKRKDDAAVPKDQQPQSLIKVGHTHTHTH